MRVLVTDGNNRAALAVTRSLGRGGHFVAVAEKQTPALAQTSRHCQLRAVYPDPAHEPDRFVEALVALVRRERIDVLLPVADITTLLVTEHRGAFEGLCRLPFADAAVVARAADKADIMRTALRLGVPIPKTVFLERIEDAAAAGAEIGYPVVVKPRRSRLRVGNDWRNCSVRYAAGIDELKALVEGWPPEGLPILLQERLEGPGLGVFMCYKHGTLTAEFSHRRLREKPPTGGVSVLSESIAVPEDARRYAKALLDDLGWHGIAMVEFKVDRRDQVPRLMEINGRFWGSLQLAIDAGVDFPALLLETLDDAPPAAPPAYRVGVRNRWLSGDLDVLLLRLFGRSARAQAAGEPSRLRALRDFFILWHPGLHYENPKLGDLGPFFFEMRQWVRQPASGREARR